jgi:hypothetical protein
MLSILSYNFAGFAKNKFRNKFRQTELHIPKLKNGNEAGGTFKEDVIHTKYPYRNGSQAAIGSLRAVSVLFYTTIK